MIETLKRSLLTYIDHFLIYDYISFGWLILLFFLLFFLAIAVVKKRPLVALFVIVFDFILIIVGPFAIKWYLDAKFRSNEATVSLVKELKFTDVLIIEGNVTNTSQMDFVTCNTYVDILKYTGNKYQDKFAFLNPIAKKSILLETPPLKGEKQSFRVLISPFRYGGDFNVSVSSECH